MLRRYALIEFLYKAFLVRKSVDAHAKFGSSSDEEKSSALNEFDSKIGLKKNVKKSRSKGLL